MFRVILFSLILSACSSKVPPASTLVSPGPSVGLFSHWVNIDSGEQVELSGAFGEALIGAISAQGFTGVATDVPAIESADFGATRTEDRARALVIAADQGVSQTLVVEATASLFSQLQGQFRWVVSVDATLVKIGDSSPTTETISVEIPVFLRYQHQGENEAFEAAAPSLERSLSPLLRGLR